jgi:NAD(P)-dependent dehydrogenase (short-subunit alcohol dehydrogenase family)
MELEGKIALVTGGAAGMGRAIVTRFVAEGAIVVAADRNAQGLDDLGASLGADGARVHPHHCDLAEGDQVDEMVDATLRAHGRIDILVNNAGIPDNYQGVGDLSLEVWDRQLAVNLVAPMRAMRRTVPAMVAQGGGSIVNIGSIASTSGAAACWGSTGTPPGCMRGMAYAATSSSRAGPRRRSPATSRARSPRKAATASVSS